MKKLFSWLLVLTMAAALFAGCGAAPAPTDPASSPSDRPQTENAPVQQVSVSTVDELLAALGSDTCITLAPGTYDLTSAADYGKESENPAYAWEACFDGYQLQLRDVQNLTIQADGKETTDLTTAPRTANVLLLNRCSRILLDGFTVGHTENGEMCNGGVLRLEDCSDTVLQNMGLYGCGTVGVDVSGMEDLRISDCEIYDCSFAGIRTYNLGGMEVKNCYFHDIGSSDASANTVLMLESSKNISVTNCTAENNDVMTLLNFNNVKAQIQNCQFAENHAVDSGFSFFGSQPVLEDNNFVGNDLRQWYKEGSEQAVNQDGKPVTEAFLPAVSVIAPAADPDGSPAGIRKAADNPELPQRQQIHVSTVDEFLAALGSDREIILDAELYDLSLASDYGKESGQVYSWFEEFDGPELVITGVSNLVITSSDGSREGHTISATPRYADVLSFKRCENIQLSGFTAGHTKEPGSCAGGVTYFDDCNNVTVDNCGLFGCGIIGVQAQYCSNVQVLNCDIYDCSEGGIRMDNVQGAVIDQCTLRNLEYYDIELQNCPDALVDGQPYAPSY